MKLSDNYGVQELVKERSDLSSKLYCVSPEGTGFGIAFHGTFVGGDPLTIAAAALVSYYQEKIEEVDHRLRDLGVNPDE